MSAEPAADLIASYEAFLITTYTVYAVTALVALEHLLTFKYEVDFLARRDWNGATWVFILNRYFLLANVSFSASPSNPTVCSSSQVMNGLEFITNGALSILPILAFTVLRVVAMLQGHSWRHVVVGFLIIVTLAVFVLDTYVGFTQIWAYVNDPLLGPSCFATGESVSIQTLERVNIAKSIMSIVSGATVLLVTLIKTVQQVRQATSLGLKMTLSEVLLRDGSLYFLLVLIVGIISAIPELNGLGLDGSVGFAIVTLSNVLPQILLSRFIINLRQVGTSTNGSSANRHLSHFSIPNFRVPTMDQVVGNLGEPLEFIEYRVDEEDDMQQTDGAEIDVASTHSTEYNSANREAVVSFDGPGKDNALQISDNGESEELRSNAV